jgi:hypothetical protein
MPLQQRNIIVGAAVLFVSVVENAQPLLPGPIGGGTTALTNGTGIATTLETSYASSWRNVGLTNDGLEVAYSPDYTDITVDQLKDAALIFASALTITMNTTMEEATLQNVVTAWGQHDSSVTLGTNQDTPGNIDQIAWAGGALGDYPVERSIIAVGNAPRTATPTTRRERIYHVRRALSVSASTHALRRTEATVFPVSFRLLPDPAYSGSEYGKIIDRTL